MNAQRGQEGLLPPDSVLHRAAERLAQQFAGMVSEETVERVGFESYAALARTANVSTHLPTVAEKFARDRLVALAQSRGLIGKPVPETLRLRAELRPLADGRRPRPGRHPHGP